jgi:hypothetical protein
MDVCVQGDKSLEIHAGVHVEEGRGTVRKKITPYFTPMYA